MPLALARGYNCKDLEALAKISTHFWLKPSTKLIVENGLKPIPIEFLQRNNLFHLQGIFKVAYTYKVKKTLQEVQ